MAGPHTLLAGTLERAIDAYLALAPNRRQLLAPLVGKVIAVRLRPFGGALYFCPTESSLAVLSEIAGVPDALLSGSLPAFVHLRLGRSVAESLAAGEIELEGDSDTARRFQNLFDHLDIGWEAHLARYTGAGFASTALTLLRSGAAWSRDTAATFRTNLAEFWQEETRELPAHPEADALFAAIDTLRADFDRLEARFKRLDAELAALQPRPLKR
jgi:ubiquinone biosynthesis protein UbiJ